MKHSSMKNIWGKDVKDWLNLKNKPKRNSKSFEFIALVSRARQQNAVNGILLHYLCSVCGFYYLNPMYSSNTKQKALLKAVLAELAKYGVDAEWDRVFRRFATDIEKRAEHIFQVIKDDIYLTENHPYFEAHGYERMHNGLNEKDIVERLDGLKEDIEKWNAEHPEEIKAHMAIVAPINEAHEKRMQEEKEKKKAERKARRDKIKADQADAKEIERNKLAHSRERKRAERYYVNLHKADMKEWEALRIR